MTTLEPPWLVGLLAIPAAVAVAGSLPLDAERYRRSALAAATLLLVLSAGLLILAGPLADGPRGDARDPFRLVGTPLLRVNALSAPLLPFTALLWALGVGVSPRGALDRHGIRRTALATTLTLATFLTESPGALLVLWAGSTAVLLRGLAAAGHRRATRITGIYLGASTLLLAVGVAVDYTVGDDPVGSGVAGVCLLLAVMIRKGIVPFHGWLPEAFEHGRIGPVVLFSAPQVGAYVALTLLVPAGAPGLLRAAGLLALVTAVYGAMAAMTQGDARRAFGYMFASQSALVFVGIESFSVAGLTGGLCLWLSSGLAFAALARCLTVLEARRGRLRLDRFNGGYERMPLLASSFLLTALAAVGFPGTLGFIGHELLIDGSVAEHPRTAFLVVVATAFGGVALLRAYFALFCGRQDPGAPVRLRAREAVPFVVVAVLLIVGGIAPRPAVRSRAAAAAEILSRRAVSVDRGYAERPR